jgi:hypothetical protein
MMNSVANNQQVLFDNVLQMIKYLLLVEEHLKFLLMTIALIGLLKIHVKYL